jgi:CysZ protein
VLNLVTPIFGAAMMVHLHKRLTRGSAKQVPPPREQASIEKL